MEGDGLAEILPVTHLNTLRKHRNLGSIGFPLPDIEAKIVDMEVWDLIRNSDVPGELVVCIPQVVLDTGICRMRPPIP